MFNDTALKNVAITATTTTSLPADTSSLLRWHYRENILSLLHYALFDVDNIRIRRSRRLNVTQMSPPVMPSHHIECHQHGTRDFTSSNTSSVSQTIRYVAVTTENDTKTQ